MKKDKDIDYTSSDAVGLWEVACKFESSADAIKALGIHWRSYYRYKAQGLPKVRNRFLIEEKMKTVLRKRSKCRK